jgi:hypothetical protein
MNAVSLLDSGTRFAVLLLLAFLFAAPVRAEQGGSQATAMLFLAVCMDFQGVYTQQLNICTKTFPETADRFDKALAGWTRRNAGEIPRVAKICESALKKTLNVNEDAAATAVELQKFFVDHLQSEVRVQGVVACDKAMAFLENEAQDLAKIVPNE